MKISKFLATIAEKRQRQIQILCEEAAPAGAVAMIIGADGKKSPVVAYYGDGEYPEPGPLMRLPSSLDQAQDLILAWQAANFDDKATVDGTLNHLATELEELRMAIADGDLPGIRSEVADLFVLITQLSALLNVELGEACLEKLVELQTRDYSAAPDEQGRILHAK